MQYSFLTEFIKRLKSENPQWFKIISRIGLFLFALGILLKALIAKQILEVEPTVIEMGIAKVNFDLDSILTGVFSSGIGLWLASQTSTTKADLQDDKTVKNLMQQRR